MNDNRDKKLLKDFGRRMERLRKSKKMSYRTLSYSADLSVSYLQKIETGISNPSYITLLRLAEAFDVTLNDLDIRNKQ
jgi:transcriptional regulator with XRE-family HTH domain